MDLVLTPIQKKSRLDNYEGHWKDDKKSGKGKFVFKDGTRQEGICVTFTVILGRKMSIQNLKDYKINFKNVTK